MRYEDMEYLNFRNIIETIDELDEPTRALIAKNLELSRTTVSHVVNSLIENEVAEETETTKPARGRPGLKLKFTSNRWFALGAAFSSDSWTFVLAGLDGTIAEKYTMPTLSDITPENLISTLLAGLRFMISRCKGSVLPAVGVGLPGIINSDEGKILFANDLGWHSPINVSEILERELGFKVYCINRYTTSGLAEYTYANPDKEKDMIFIGIGSGIRSAIFVNGNLMTGTSYMAGRIAHLVVDPEGPLCDCGKRGCLLTVANTKALRQNAILMKNKTEYSQSVLASIPEDAITTEAITELADDGDPCAKAVIDSIAAPLTKCVGALVEVINPRKVVLGGTVGYSSRYLVDQVRKSLEENMDSQNYSVLKVEQGKLMGIGSALGAATLVLQNKAELLFKLIQNND